MLLYVVEGAVPILTWLLVMALMKAFKGDFAGHRKWAPLHAYTTLVSCGLVALLVKLGFRLGDKAPGWIMDIHLVIIYAIPVMIVIQLITARKKMIGIHKPVAILYTLNWCAALVTGAMIFAMDRGLM